MLAIAPETINPLALPSLPLAKRRQLPNIAAIYFVLEDDKVVYIGQASSLVLRWVNHQKLKALKKKTSSVRLAWLECSDLSLLSLIESALIKFFNPDLNERHTEKGRAKKRETFTVLPTGTLKKVCFDRTGSFVSSSLEPLTENLNVRVPASLKIQVQAVAGDRLPDWLREAVLEKLERERQQQTA